MLVSDPRILLTAIGLLSSIVVFVGLDGGSLADWDEAIYAEVAKEIVSSGQWMVLQYRGTPFFDKPPLVFWLVALTYSKFGVSELTSRIWPAIFGVLTLVLVTCLGLRMFDKRTGLLAAIILLWNTTTPHLNYPILSYLNYGIPLYSAQQSTFVWMSRSLMLDVPLTFFSIATLWAFWESLSRPRFIVFAGITAGLGFMTKGAEILPTLAVLLVFLIATRRWRTTIKSRFFYTAVLAFFFVALPWHIYQVLVYGQEFLQGYIGYHVILRTLIPLEGHVGSYFFYFLVLAQVFGFWNLTAVAGLVIVATGYLKERRDQNLLILVWLGLPILMFTIAQTKIAWYMVPTYPAIALLVGRTLSDFSRRISKTAFAGSLATIAGFLVSFPAFVVGIATALAFYFLFSLPETFGSFWRKTRRLRAWLPVLVVAFIVLSGLTTFSPQDIRYVHNEKAVALVAKQVVPPSTTLVAFMLDSPTFDFYSSHQIVDVNDPAQLAVTFQHDPGAYVVTEVSCESLSFANLTLVFQSGAVKLLKHNTTQLGSC
jgi:4-amino-4-deoxy-L-arabinose transferase-like glycosyltransferase